MALSQTLGSSLVVMNDDESTVTYNRQSVGALTTVYGLAGSNLILPQYLSIRHSASVQKGVTIDRHNINVVQTEVDSVSGVVLPITINFTVATPRVDGATEAKVKDLAARLISLLYGTASDVDLESASFWAGGNFASILNNFS